jgi:hypothetical protein
LERIKKTKTLYVVFLLETNRDDVGDEEEEGEKRQRQRESAE